MKDVRPVSRWIAINSKEVTERNPLYCYGEDTENGKRYVNYFRYKGKEYALDRFLWRYGVMGFDTSCENYPSYITGYDGEDYSSHALMCSIDEYGEKIRLYREF